MTKPILFTLILGMFSSITSYSQIVINEVESDTPGADLLEFVELYGSPGTSLDGHVIVFFNGLNNASYASYDLDGYSLDGNGFFVLGNTAVSNVDLVYGDNVMQNGADAIALYQGNSSNWPNGTPISLVSLLDALVYDTDDADDLELLTLIPGQSQVNESANGFPVDQSMSRLPNGGNPLQTTTYVAQQPTPGVSNELQCIGGTISTTNAETTLNLCVDDNSEPILLEALGAVGESYLWIFTQTNNTILSTFTSGSFDPDDLIPGTCRLYGLAYSGTLNSETVLGGEHIDNVLSDGCAVVSYNFITINKELCNDPECNGGDITDSLGAIYIVACLDNNADIINFAVSTDATATSYTWIITDNFGTIVLTTDLDFLDFNEIPAGTYNIYGISHEGPLDASTLEEGDDIPDIQGTGYCFDISNNFITVITQACETGPGCSDLFFSEYIEGASNNKAVELFNPTSETINLTGYAVHTYNNGSPTPTNTFNLTGTVGPEEVFVISNSQADFFILNQADYTSSITWYNGNDALVLYHDGEAIDAIGVPGDDPITAWVVGTGTTGEHTLVRKVNVTEGTTDWVLGASQWNVYPQNTFSFLGGHSFLGCEFLNTPQISLSTSVQSVNENSGNAVVEINVFNPIYAVDVTISLLGGTASAISDYTNVLPITLTFPQGSVSPQYIEIPIIDDLVIESDETIIIQLSAGTEVVLLQQEQTITIEDNDALIPQYDIIEVTAVNTESVADSLGIECILQGIVHGVNTFPGGVQFTLIDETDGIGVFNGDSNFGYTVQEGDEVVITGIIDQFNGLTQITPSSIEFLSSANPINSPEIVSELNELTESAIVELKCVELVDPSQWDNTLPGFNVQISDGNIVWEVRIDGDTEIFGSAAPEGHFSVSGIGGQFDSSIPYDSGFQLLPRYFADFSPSVVADFSNPGDISFGVGQDITITFENLSEGGTNYLWNFGDGTTASGFDADHTYYFDFLSDNPTITIVLIVTGLQGCLDTYSITISTNYIGISELENRVFNLALYPNPANELMNYTSACEIDEIIITDMKGREVHRENFISKRSGSFSLKEQSEGMYLVRAIGDCGESVRRIIKQ